MEFINSIGDRLDKVLENKTVTLVISLVLVLYAGLAAPALPNSVVKFFDTMVGKVLFLFLIGFMASRNVQVALMIAVAYVVTLHVANKRATEEYINFLKNERFENYYELFKDDAKDEINNRGLVVPILCDHIKMVNLKLKEDDRVMTTKKDEDEMVNDKLKKDHKDMTVKQFFEHINSKENVKDEHKMDGFIKKNKKLALKKLKEGKKEELVNVKSENKEKVLKDLLKKMEDEKIAEICNFKVEKFTNYEDFVNDDEIEDFNNYEQFTDDMEMGEDFEEGEDMGEDFEEGKDMGEDFEEGKTNEDGEDMGEDNKEYLENMEEFQNFNVVPADNLNGNAAKMYAPVTFN